MSYGYADRSDEEPLYVDDEPPHEARLAGRAASTVLAFVMLALAFVLFGLSGSVSGGAQPWLFCGAIAAFALAYAIPTAILPALEDR
ncbi:hypothetical protein [Cellulomonas sp. SG140]|uniref:hypothetical protein n=1 Tax=Cellulomonas sp. SG140 TaxID=2976536 RepID=UPI0021E8F281|nr:hypothetical protein [Cellulomonas sp. SG140]